MVVQTIRNLVDPHYLKKLALIINFYFGISLGIIVFVAMTQCGGHIINTQIWALFMCGRVVSSVILVMLRRQNKIESFTTFVLFIIAPATCTYFAAVKVVL